MNNVTTINSVKTFTVRNGLQSPLPIQINSMNNKLRNQLWNMFNIDILQQGIIFSHYGICWKPETKEDVQKLWSHHFGEVITAELDIPDLILNRIKAKFDQLSWAEIYEFLEFVFKNFTYFHYDDIKNKLINKCNNILEEERSAYIFHDGEFIEKFPKVEFDAISHAIQESTDETTCHLKKSYDYYFDKKNPDFENSIKESISAIEALCRKITGKKSNTLGSLIGHDKFRSLHPCMRDTIEKLYAYASDKGGVRHGAKEGDPPVTKEEARFILVTSSSIINYLNNIFIK